MKYTTTLEEVRRFFLNNSLLIICKFWSTFAVSPNTNGFCFLLHTVIPKEIGLWKQTLTKPQAGTEMFPHHAGCRLGPRGCLSLDISLHQVVTHTAVDSPKRMQWSETSKATSATSRNCFLSQTMPNCQIACDLSQLPLATLPELPAKPMGQKP